MKQILQYLALTGILAAGCSTTQNTIRPNNLEQELTPSSFNPSDPFTEMCFHFGGEYCQIDCAVLQAESQKYRH